jgi:hypothetical protein
MARLWIPAALLATALVAERTVARALSPEGVVQPAHTPVSSFIMTIGGKGGTVAVGEASYRRGPGGTQFSLELGGRSGEGAVLFATEGMGPVAPGRYTVDDRPGPGALHALVFTGTPTAPTGIYRVQGGSLTVRSAGQGVIEGSFDLRAIGFKAEQLQQDDQVISVAGSFMATEQ